MELSALHAEVARLEGELQQARDLLAQAAHDPEALTAELVRTRAYAFSAAANPVEETVAACALALERYGFCVIDNVIPADQVDAIRDEVVAAQATIGRNVEAIQALKGREDLRPEEVVDDQGASHGVDLRPVRRVGCPPKPPNDIIWMPLYAQYLAHPVVTSVARRVLDDHLRIAQLHPRIIETDRDGIPGGFGSPALRGRANSREWHTDWPHDLSAYGRDDPNENVGCVRQPFPDVAMCLVMIWYLTDTDENSGGTWVVPGSHKDKRNPRGPRDGISVTAPIPGDMQVSAPKGSVYIQDSRSWHASAMHNPSGRARVAMVNRWCPWWLSVDDYAPGERYSTNIVCRPLSPAEFKALPVDLQPLMRHLCPAERDTLQPQVLARAGAADRRNQVGFRQLEKNPEELATANAHIRVALGRS